MDTMVAPQSRAEFRIVCAWCKAVIQEGPTHAPISHGMCSTCEKSFEEPTLL